MWAPWTVWWVLGLTAAGAWAALRAWTPLGDPVCALRQIAHIGCATCGLTRAFAALAKGELGASLAFHPMALVLAGEIVAKWAAWGLALLRGAAVPETRGIPRLVAANALAFLLVWIVRLVTGTIPV